MLPQPNSRLVSVSEFDASSLKRERNGIYGLHICRHRALGSFQALDRLDRYIGLPSEIGLFDSSHRARSPKLLPGDDQNCTYRPFDVLIG
jgi:hypothetical protein